MRLRVGHDWTAVEIADNIVFVGLPVELHPRRCGTEIIEIRRAAGLGDLI
jgi:hypothetical protein